MNSDDEFREKAKEFWREIVFKEDGTLDEQKVIDELHDFYFMICEVPKVYSEITGGQLSKPNYYASSVLSAHSSYLEELMDEIRHEAVRDAFEMLDAGHSREEIYAELAPDPYPHRRNLTVEWNPDVED